MHPFHGCSSLAAWPPSLGGPRPSFAYAPALAGTHTLNAFRFRTSPVGSQ